MKFRYISQRWQVVKSYYSGIGKSAVIYPSTFLVAIGIGLVILGMVFFVRDIFNATPAQVGFLSAVRSLSFIFGCTLLRPLFNRMLPRYLMITASFLMSLFAFFILFTKNFFFVYVFYGCFGCAMSLFWPTLMGWLSQDTEATKLGKVMSIYNLSWSLGTIISPFLAGFLSGIASDLPIYLGSGLFLLTSSLITGASLALPKIRADVYTSHIKDRTARTSDKSTLLRFPAWVGLYTTYVVMGIIFSIFPVFARDELVFGKGLIGLLLQARAVAATIGFVLLGRIAFWHFRVFQMLIGQLIMAAVLFFIRSTTSPLLLGTLIAIIGACMSLSYFNSLFHGVSGSTNPAGRMAVHESLVSGGLISGSSVGGLLYQNYSMATVFLFSSSLVGFGVVIQGLLGLMTLYSKREKKVSFF